MKDISDFFAHEGDYGDIDISAAAERLSQAVRCVTVNDGLDYSGFDKLQALIRDSFPRLMAASDFELIGHSLLITLPGADPALRPALFMSHQDVVPVVEGTEKDWSWPPFSGTIDGGYIWGRGTLDIKQQVMGVLEAAEYLLAHGKRFGRTVYFAFGEDEETYNLGAKAISDTLKARGVTLEFVLDEGGGMIKTGESWGAPDIFVSEIAVMEKGYADLELSVKSAGGHSSRPFGGSSLGRLSQAIADITRSPFPAELSPVLRSSFLALEPYITQEPLRSLVLDMDKDPEALAQYCMTVPQLFPQVTTTIAPTVIRGSSSACNVLPQNMEAVINFRIAQSHTAAEVMEHCAAAVSDSGLSLRFLQSNDPSAQADTQGFGYAVLTRAMCRYFDGVVFVPAMTVGATDARRYEQICACCLRFSPFMANAEDAERGVHGTDERISLRAYVQGIRALIHMMELSCM